MPRISTLTGGGFSLRFQDHTTVGWSRSFNSYRLDVYSELFGGFDFWAFPLTKGRPFMRIARHPKN